MKDLELVGLSVAGVAILVLGAAVLSRAPRQKSLRAFMLFCSGVAAWILGVSAFIASNNMAQAWFFANLYYCGALFIGIMAPIFKNYWLGRPDPARSVRWLLCLFVAFIGLLVVDPHFILEAIYFQGANKTVDFNFFGYSIFTALFLFLFSSALLDYIKSLPRLTALKRSQTEFIIAGMLSAGFLGVWFNLLLPWLGIYNYIWVGPIASVLFVGCVGYAIVRRKLFDIHSFFIRAAVYLFSVVLLSLLYIVPSILLVAYVMDIKFSWPRLSTGTAVALLFALFYGQAREKFYKFSNRLLYRGYYEPQDLYDQLNKTLVASQTMEEIITNSLSIIESSIKPEFALVGLKDGSTGERVFGTRKLKLDPADVATARKITTRIHHKVIVADYLDDAYSFQAKLKEVMRHNNVAVIVRLTHDVRPVEEGLGYLLLGYRKSGNPYSQKDITVLDTVGNQLVIAIQNALHVEEIQQFNVTLQQRVDEATRRTRQTNQRLKMLDETKDDFISMASHQLRTPLTSVKGYLSMVLEGDAGEITPRQRKMLGQAYISSQRMVFLIADLLNLSRLRTGKFVIQPVKTDLSQLVKEEMSQLVDTAKARDITLTYVKPKDFPTLQLDETKIRQVVMNFVDNAIYYTPSGGKITIELSADARHVSLKVIDNGIGVAKADQHRLFTKFYRAPNARQARPDGTGLGLFMAKKVVLAQGGHLIFDSQEGKGSTFGFVFPLKSSTVPPTNPELKPSKETLAKPAARPHKLLTKHR